MSPEFLLSDGDHKQGSHKVDVYSFAVTVWEMYAVEQPFHGATEAQLKRDVPRGVRPAPFAGSALFPPAMLHVQSVASIQ